MLQIQWQHVVYPPLIKTKYTSVVCSINLTSTSTQQSYTLTKTTQSSFSAKIICQIIVQALNGKIINNRFDNQLIRAETIC